MSPAVCAIFALVSFRRSTNCQTIFIALHANGIKVVIKTHAMKAYGGNGSSVSYIPNIFFYMAQHPPSGPVIPHSRFF
jgi:hypothetical protein